MTKLNQRHPWPRSLPVLKDQFCIFDPWPEGILFLRKKWHYCLEATNEMVVAYRHTLSYKDIPFQYIATVIF